jgi:hypothetical protein
MILFIEPETSLHALQQSFHQVYPFLSIRFFQNKTNAEGVVYRVWLDSEKTVKEVSRRTHLHGVIELHYWDKTSAVQQTFQQSFGLGVQVFRKHGLEWIEVNGTDNLTLEEQNEIGMETSKSLLNGTLY